MLSTSTSNLIASTRKNPLAIKPMGFEKIYQGIF
jgi:hypothetical protein